MNNKDLFSIKNLSTFTKERSKTATSAIKRLTDIKDVNEPDLVEQYFMKYKLECPIIILENIRYEINRSESTTSVYIPFKGNEELLNYVPSSGFCLEFPKGNVYSNEIVFEVSDNNDADFVKSKSKENCSLINTWLQFTKKDCDKFNIDLKRSCEDAVADRIKYIKERNNLEKTLNESA